MNWLAAALFMIGPLSVGALTVLLAFLGKHLGRALELPPYYRFYYVSAFFFFVPVPAGLILMLTGAWGFPDTALDTGLIIRLVFTSLPMGIAVTLAVFATTKYWGWIWKELGHNYREGGKRDAE